MTDDAKSISAQWKQRAEALKNRTPEERAKTGIRFNRRMASAFRTVGRDADAVRAEQCADKWADKR